MLDSDLAELYQVPTKSLNLAVKRNAARFPDDFMFRLTQAEADLRFQIETSKRRGGRRYLPYASRAGRRDVSERSPQHPCRSGEHRHHAHIRAPTADSRHAQGYRGENSRPWSANTTSVLGWFRDSTPSHGVTSRGAETSYRLRVRWPEVTRSPHEAFRIAFPSASGSLIGRKQPCG